MNLESVVRVKFGKYLPKNFGQIHVSKKEADSITFSDGRWIIKEIEIK